MKPPIDAVEEKRSARFMIGVYGLLIPIVSAVVLQATAVTYHLPWGDVSDWNLDNPWVPGFVVPMAAVWLVCCVCFSFAPEFKNGDPTGILGYVFVSIVLWVLSVLVTIVIPMASHAIAGWLV